MRRSTKRILTTHTAACREPEGGGPVAAKRKAAGANHAALDAAVAEAVADVVGQAEGGGHRRDQRRRAGSDRLHRPRHRPPDRLRGQARAAARHRRTRVPELAQLLSQFASPFQRWPACSGRLSGRILPPCKPTSRAPRRDDQRRRRGIFHDLAVARADRALSDEPAYKTVEEYLFTLADVMAREYRAIVEAGFVLQLDCRISGDVLCALSGHQCRGLPQDHRRQRRGAESFDQGSAARPHAHARVLGLNARPHHGDIPIKDIRRYYPQGQAAGGVIPAQIRAMATSGRCGRTLRSRPTRSSSRA